MDVDLQENILNKNAGFLNSESATKSITVKGIWREILDRTNTGDYKTAEELLLHHLQEELNIFGVVWIFRLFKNAETLEKWTIIEDLVLNFISKNNIAVEDCLSAQITQLIAKWIKNQKQPDKLIEEVDNLRQNFASTDHERIWLLVLMYHMTPFRSGLKTQRSEQLVQIEPNNAYFKYVRAYHEEQFQRVESAIQLYREAIDLNPYFVDAMINLGNCYNSIHQFEDAIDWYDRALLNREDVDAIMNKTVALSNNLRFDNALQTIEELIQKEPTEEAYLVKVSIWKRMGEHDLTLNEFDNVIKLYPKSSKALIEKAEYLAILYREEEGFLLMDQAAEIDPKNTKVLLERAEYYANYGSREKALEMIDEIVAQPDLNSANIHFCKAKILEAMSKYDEAIKEISIAINTENDEAADYYYKMGLIYVQQTKFRLAEISFKKSVDLLPTSETYWELAKLKETTGYYYESLDYYNLALKEDPFNINFATTRNWMRARIAQDEDKETL